MSEFRNKAIVITGAANGLGRALAIEFYKMGCHLALCDIDQTGLEKLKSEIENENQKISIHVCDVSKEDDVIHAKQEMLDQHQKVDILINNAGVSISQSFEQMAIKDFKWLFETNFWGMVYCTKCFLPILKLQNESRIVNIISSFATIGFPGKTAYGSSKAAILAFTNSLYTDLADSRVKLSYVIPPAIKTGIVLSGKHISEDKMIRESLYLEKNGMEATIVAQKIISKIKKDKFRIVIGYRMYWIDLISRIFPTILLKLIVRNKSTFDFI